MAKSKRKGTCVSVELNNEIFRFLEGHCERTGKTKSAVLRVLIVDWKRDEESRERQP